MSFVMPDDFSVRVTKVTSRIGISWTHSLAFCFWPIFNLMNYGMRYEILSKGYKLDNFESHNSKTWLFKYLRPLFKFYWLWIFPWIKLSWNYCSLWDKHGWLNCFWQFLCEGLSSFNPKGFYYSYEWTCSLYEDRTSFYMRLISRKL